MSTLGDVAVIDSGIYPTLTIEVGSAILHLSAGPMIGIHTTSPSTNLHVAGTRAVYLTPSASRPAGPPAGTLHMSTVDGGVPETHDGSRWRVARRTGLTPWGRLVDTKDLAGLTSYAVPLSGFRFARIVLSGVVATGAVEVSMRVGGSEVTGGYASGIYGTTGDGTRTARFVHGNGLVRGRIVDGTVVRATAAGPLTCQIDVHNLQAGATNLPVLIHASGFAYDSGTASTLGLHWALTRTPPLAAAADGVVLRGTFSAGLVLAFAYP